jgi:beta-glucuronidase
VRRIEVKGHQIKLNGQAIAMRGFGMHEDFASLGKGQNLAVTMRDLELLKWTGANTLRTSHYPYAEETLDLADQRGLLVISELACVNLDFRKLSDKLLAQHQKTLKAQIERDAKHPSVIMWSIANEPGYLGEPEYKEKSGDYWRTLYKTAKELDPTRPVTTANVDYSTRDDPAFEICDVVCINRYYGWYNMPGQLDRALKRMDEELEYVSRHDKPVIVTEFGADAISGMHSISDQLFTEEYQAKFTDGYIRLIESKPYCAGVLVWNFADFRTAQHFRRVIVNRKGMFARDRSPKAAAFKLKETWAEPRQMAQ